MTKIIVDGDMNQDEIDTLYDIIDSWKRERVRTDITTRVKDY